MPVLDTVLAAVVGGGGVSLATLGVQWLKNRSDSADSHHKTDAQIEQHRDGLTFDLLAAARAEGQALRAEVAELRPLVARLAHFDEALDHLHAVLHASGPEEVKAAARRARAFLTRMRRLADARGAIINEVQRAQSAASLNEGQEE